MNKLKRAALQVIAEQLTETELIGLRATFDAMDTNQDGKLTYHELQQALEDQVCWRSSFSCHGFKFNAFSTHLSFFLYSFVHNLGF